MLKNQIWIKQRTIKLCKSLNFLLYSPLCKPTYTRYNVLTLQYMTSSYSPHMSEKQATSINSVPNGCSIPVLGVVVNDTPLPSFSIILFNSAEIINIDWLINSVLHYYQPISQALAFIKKVKLKCPAFLTYTHY